MGSTLPDQNSCGRMHVMQLGEAKSKPEAQPYLPGRESQKIVTKGNITGNRNGR